MLKDIPQDWVKAFLFYSRNWGLASFTKMAWRSFKSGYVKGVFYSLIKKSEWTSLPSQKELIVNLFDEGNFILIILDAFRYDCSKILFPRYLGASPKRVASPASGTLQWLEKVIPLISKQLRDCKIFGAHPALNSLGVKWGTFRLTDYAPSRNIVDVWKYGWNSDLKTVPPENVIKIVKEEGLGNKNIIWFVQPHYPYLGRKKLYCPGGWQEVVRRIRDPDDPLTSEHLREAYISNAQYVLKNVVKMIKESNFPGKIVISSDHGELLGEYGLYFHSFFLFLPELRVVPYLEIEQARRKPKEKRIEIKKEKRRYTYSKAEEEIKKRLRDLIKKRLRDLGYLE